MLSPKVGSKSTNVLSSSQLTQGDYLDTITIQ